MTAMTADAKRRLILAAGLRRDSRQFPAPRRRKLSVRMAILIFAVSAAVLWIRLLIQPGPLTMGAMRGDGTSLVWSPAHVLATMLMWSMMSAAMAPIAACALAQPIAKTARSNPDWAQFCIGSVLAWLALGVAMAMAQCLLEWARLLSPAMTLNTRQEAGIFLLGIGLVELLSLHPVFIKTAGAICGKEGGAAGPDRTLRFKEGLACAVRCGPQMLAGFVFGPMNPVWMALMTGFSIAEGQLGEMAPAGEQWLRLAVSWALILSSALSLAT